MSRPGQAVRPGEELPELRRVVTREDIRAYAETGGDHNPLHQDDDVARAAGFSGVIAHGMFTMGHLSTCVVGWAGDARSVLELSANFRAPVLLGEELIAGGRVSSVDEVAATATIDAWVRVDREGETVWPIKRARAVVRLR